MAHRIVVIGAGYAGLTAAGRASRLLRGAHVTLVNAAPDFVERVRLHQAAVGHTLHKHRLADVVHGTGIELVIGRVTALDAQRRELLIDTRGEPLGYDTLVYALGSGPDTAGVPGTAEHAVEISGPDGAHALRDRIRERAGRGVLTVVGGGLTGIEAATELAESHPLLRVRLLSATDPGDALSPRGAAHLRRVFDRLGIDVHSGARVEEVRHDAIALAGGRTVGSDITVWASGFTVPGVAQQAGLAVNDKGRVIVDQTLRSVSHPEVYAVGDSAVLRRPDGLELRMACATGLPAGWYAAGAVAKRLTGREPRSPFTFTYFQQCISLGRRDGLIQFTDRDDRPRQAVLTGSAAVQYKEAIVRGASWAARTARSTPERRRTAGESLPIRATA